MKNLLFAALIWLLCGALGAYLRDTDGTLDPKHIAWGPVTLVQVFTNTDDAIERAPRD